jgi:stringent starvation protein B
MAETSTKPYLIRAIHEWCTDNGYRPYVAVAVDERTIVPREFVRNGEIVLNMSADATNRLRIGNDLIEFEARFNRAAREVSIPIENVTAVYAAENGHGMAFDVPRADAEPSAAADESGASEQGPGQPQPSSTHPAPRGPVLLEAVPTPAPDKPDEPASSGPPEHPPPPAGGRPKLTRIK